MGVNGAKNSISNLGRIRNHAKSIAYYPKASGPYAVFGLKTGLRVPVHVLVHVLHNDPLLLWRRHGDSVDHKDRTSANNNRLNLRWASKTEQVANRSVLKKSGLNCVPVTLTKDGVQSFYASSALAAEACGADPGYLSRRHGRTCKGYHVVKHDTVALPGEVWRTHSPGLRVSNFGRVQYDAVYGKRMYEPEPRVDGYKRCKLPGSKSHKNVGHLVLEAFGNAQPSPQHTVNHIDLDRGNNRLENLEWNTKVEQVQNQRKPSKHGVRRGVEFRIFGSNASWNSATDISDASAKTGCKYSGSNNCPVVGNRQRSTPGFDGLRYEFRWLATPEFDDIDGEVWKPIVVADWDVGGKYHFPGIGVSKSVGLSE